MAVKLITKYADKFIDNRELSSISNEVAAACGFLNERNGKGSEFLGWLDLPFNYDRDEFARIKKAAQKIREDSDVLVVVGIGGSYLGARAVIEFLSGGCHNERSPLKVYFAGNSLSGRQLKTVAELCDGKRVSVNVISKSGTTTEPALAFRIFKDMLEARYGKAEAAKRIYATTDSSKGTLKRLADAEGYETFVVPDDVGGRYSVLTAVGLLPIAAAGYDIDALMSGAADEASLLASDGMDNPSNRYAAYRNLFYRSGKSVELLSCFEPAFYYMNEWYKQLFGESEGKDNKGLLPASVVFSADLHSMGQYVQDGARIMFETVVSFESAPDDVRVKPSEDDFDSLNYLAGKSMLEINTTAQRATILAHNDGGVPCLIIESDDCGERSLGALIYFFERSCAVSGYLLGVNPFDQPGVEDYKRNMFALLGKPGYEELREKLENEINE